MKKDVEKEDFYVQKVVEEDEIDLLEILTKLYKNKMIIILFVIVGVFFSVIGGIVYKKNMEVTRGAISFNFEEIIDGKNPDGSVFDAKKIIPNLAYLAGYDRYKEITGKNLSLTEFKDYIKVESVIPKEISIIIERNLKEGKKYNFTPTEYFISFNSKLDNENKKEILQKIINFSIDDYRKNYLSMIYFPILNEKEILKDNFSYEKYLKIIDFEIEKIENSIKNKEIKKINFKDSSFNYTFQDILLDLDFIKKLKLNQIKEFLDIDYISSDLERTKKSLLYELQEYKIDREVLIKKIQALKEMIDGYKISEKNIILPNTTVEVSNGKDNYANFISDYVETSKELEINIQNTKKTERKIAELKMGNDKENKYIIDTLKDVIELVNEQIKRTNELNKKYYEKENSDMITQISPVESVYTGKPLALFVVVGAFLSFVIGCMYVLFREISKERNSSK